MSRVQALLNRMVEYASDANTIKTCCGVLSILSRSEDKKTEIANAGLAIVLQAMNAHMANEDLVEAACDLLWTLAFNNKPVKASISAHGGISTLLRCVDVHRLNPALLRSALGTLSNLSQLADNQQHIGVGLPVVVAAMQLHVRNVDLLAFALDTLTSIIIGHDRNCRVVYDLGIIDFLLDVLKDYNQHASASRLAVVKSACHTLAILCELQGVGKCIADAHGVAAIVAAMCAAAPLPTDVERIITVLLFRISKDPAVVPQMVHDGVVLVLFRVLANQRTGAMCSETLLATCHILCLMTQFASSHAVDLSPYVPVSSCHGDLLLRLAADNTAPLALSIFRLLAHLSRNPVPLPALVNVATMESMLALATLHGNPPEMLQLVLDVVVHLRRSMIAAQPLRSPEKSLAALLVAIRTFPEDIELLDQVFCVVTAYSLSDSSSHPRTVFGFIGAAMRCLSRYSSANWAPQCMIEACRFLLHVMGSKEGVDSMVSCGGVNILCQFNRDVFAAPADVPADLQKLLHAMCLRLETPFAGPSPTAPAVMKSEVVGEAAGCMPSGTQQHDDDDDEDEEDENPMEEDEEDEDEEDSDYTDELRVVDHPQVDDEAVAQCDHRSSPDDGAASAPPPCTAAPSSVVTADASTPLRPVTVPPAALVSYLIQTFAHPQDVVPSERSAATVSEHRYTYTSHSSGYHLPKHPLVRLPSGGAPQPPAATTLLTTCPVHNEPATSTFASSADMQQYIELRMAMRVALVQTNHADAQVVYQSTRPAGNASLASAVPTDVYPYAVGFPTSSDARRFGAPLTFDSEFDAGNLLRAVQVADTEFDLILRPDVHTTGYTQWFYFAVANAEPSVAYTFHIVNLYKPDSLFNTGLQPVVYSVQDASTDAIGWKRAGTDVCYYANPYKQPKQTKADDGHASTFFTMSFTLTFPRADDTYLIAHSYPYTMADHKWHLRQPPFQCADVVRKSVLCRTLGQQDCDVLSITDFAYTHDSLETRPVIVLTARVHPGEPQASWVMRGVLDFLVSDAPDAKLLRRVFVFKVVPVLNPDGVLYGNNRCGLAGCDLNRQWKAPTAARHPTIFAIKAVMQTLPVVFYCDIHGHSRKKNVFMYGCDTPKHANPIARTFPKLLSSHWVGRQYVSLDSCNFQVNRGRESTARVVVGRDMGIANSFTLEASFCGADFGRLANQHFNLRHFDDIGLALGQSLADYAMPDGMDRGTVYEWLQSPDECQDIRRYIETLYNGRLAEQQLAGIVPLHMTLGPLFERKGSFARLLKKPAKGTHKKKKKKKAASQPPAALVPVIVVPKQLSLPTAAITSTGTLKKPSTKPAKKAATSSGPKVILGKPGTPPPLALKKALSLPSPKIQATRLKNPPLM
ncbi:hypothetical protein DYB32_004890 [Aphanomyces invadans]|uniref:tubulin-glutamate carboxypeptidase n=1 Tax=Aphanomyces invadans TaxID=157072 RepID=A0A3R6Z476_9STRA|nr:hypothetical protein DYB32_004890 [Aphanomyces invadans]